LSGHRHADGCYSSVKGEYADEVVQDVKCAPIAAELVREESIRFFMRKNSTKNIYLFRMEERRWYHCQAFEGLKSER
jgi:hypothetical protein